MDSWPSRQCDGPHPQDAPVHSMAEAIDLSRRREALVNAGAAETLNGAPGSGCVSGVPVGDRRVSPPCLEWPTGRTEVPDGPVRTKGEAAGGACFAQLGQRKSATASQWGSQKAERQNGSVHPRQRDGCAAGSWGCGPCSSGAESHVATQGCYAVNGGHPYGTGGAVCTAPVSPGAREAPPIESQSPAREIPVTGVLDAKRTGPPGEKSSGATALGGPERLRKDRSDEALVTESSWASPRPGASPLDNEGVWGNHLDAAVGCHLKGLSTCSLRTVTSKTIHNVIPLLGVKAANRHPPEQHGSLDAEGSKMQMSLQSGVCDVGDVQASLETSAWSGEEGTKAAGDVHGRQQPECVVLLPQTCSPLARPSLVATRPESSLPDTSPPSGKERDDPKSLSAGRAGRGGTGKCSASSRVIAKRPRSARKRPRSVQVGPSTLFAPREPEITLRYASHKGERRCSTAADTFVPYVHLERGEFSVCCVVNSPEERAGRWEGQPQADSQFSSSAVPSSSCLLLGRLAPGGGARPGPLCCLCHRASNVLELGDLHGPYRPIGTGPARPPPSTAHAPEEEESNQSDSSCSLQGGAPKRGLPSETAHGHLGDRDGCLMRPTKRPKEGSLADERYCPGAGEPDPREYWIHEDCGVWSPGVYLVQGKLYGLEEAVHFGQEMVCSLCHKHGATLGCFFKTCPSKFHYSCAVQADCVLNKENFCMKCPTHKNRPVKGLAQPEHW